jgi:hypothetical protein
MVVPIMFALAAPPAQAAANSQFEACKTLGGEYEERRSDCNPDCKTTYICRFDEGWSRVCDEKGVCKQGQDSQSSQQADEDSDESDDSDSSALSEECEDCLDLCEGACDVFRQSWRRDECEDECESRCDYSCD